MQGIPYRDNDFSKNDQLYKILWSGVNEPNKLEKTKGEIFLLLRPTDAEGVEEGDPRLYAVEYNPLLLEKIMEIPEYCQTSCAKFFIPPKQSELEASNNQGRISVTSSPALSGSDSDPK